MVFPTSPREIYLESEVSRLQAENAYLRRLAESDDRMKFSILNEPETITPGIPPTSILHLGARGGFEDDVRHDSKHVFIREEQPNGMQLNYYISNFELLTARDRQALLASMNERVLLQIGKAFAEKLP